MHRTGHSIDRDLHGSGPHLDNYETHDDREILPGAGFSVEPGIYLPGEFGVRSEVNMVWAPAGPMVTPQVPQVELITAVSRDGGSPTADGTDRRLGRAPMIVPSLGTSRPASRAASVR